MKDGWPFDDPPNLAVFTLVPIIDRSSPILLVSHDADDGGWQFLDGEEVAMSGVLIVWLGFMARLDPSIGQLADLPLGWDTRRADPDSPWQRARQPAE